MDLTELVAKHQNAVSAEKTAEAEYQRALAAIEPLKKTFEDCKAAVQTSYAAVREELDRTMPAPTNTVVNLGAPVV